MLVPIIGTEHGPAISIPEELLAECHFSAGDSVKIYIRRGKPVIADPSEPYYTTEELVAGITDENMHTAIEWGPPVGKELW
jgi:antitoxin MazE